MHQWWNHNVTIVNSLKLQFSYSCNTKRLLSSTLNCEVKLKQNVTNPLMLGGKKKKVFKNVPSTPFKSTNRQLLYTVSKT